MTNHSNLLSPMSKWVTFTDIQQQNSVSSSDEGEVATGKKSVGI